MPTIIIARFDTLADAASAAHALMAEGFREDSVSVFRGVDRRGERWPGRLVYTGMLRTVALGTAGAAVAATVSALLSMPDAYAVASAASGALAGSFAGAVLTRIERRAAGEGGLRSPAAFVAVVAETGEEAKGRQLLRDAGGRDMERMRGRYMAFAALHDAYRMDEPLRTGLPIP
jgi:uncharacterized membrane protein YeaQ/YmgE (transglycosylase-associated protein family)